MKLVRSIMFCPAVKTLKDLDTIFKNRSDTVLKDKAHVGDDYDSNMRGNSTERGESETTQYDISLIFLDTQCK